MKIIIVDNGLSVTGAFNAVIKNIKKDECNNEYLFYIPENSTNKIQLNTLRLKYYTFKSVELSRTLYNIVMYLPFLFFNSYKLARVIKKEKISWIHQNEIFILSGICAKIFVKVKVLTHIRVMPTIFPTKIFKAWLYLQNRFSDKLVTVSFAAQKAAQAIYKPIKELPVWYDFVVPNEKLQPFVVKESELFKICFIGNYTRGKGQEIALEAFKICTQSEQIKNISISFYGGDFGLPLNVAFKNELKSFIDKNELQHNAFLYDFVEDVESVMKDADLLLNLSAAESFSFVVAEGMSYGIPIIASNSGGPGELIENDTSGIVLPDINPKKVAEAISSLIFNIDKRLLFNYNSKKRIRDLVLEFGRMKFAEIYN